MLEAGQWCQAVILFALLSFLRSKYTCTRPAVIFLHWLWKFICNIFSKDLRFQYFYLQILFSAENFMMFYTKSQGASPLTLMTIFLGKDITTWMKLYHTSMLYPLNWKYLQNSLWQRTNKDIDCGPHVLGWPI